MLNHILVTEVVGEQLIGVMFWNENRILTVTLRLLRFRSSHALNPISLKF
jgi:hypothetical protein